MIRIALGSAIIHVEMREGPLTTKLACALEDVKFKHDAFIYGVHELPVAW